jgi:hypothetical protein
MAATKVPNPAVGPGVPASPIVYVTNPINQIIQLEHVVPPVSGPLLPGNPANVIATRCPIWAARPLWQPCDRSRSDRTRASTGGSLLLPDSDA